MDYIKLMDLRSILRRSKRATQPKSVPESSSRLKDHRGRIYVDTSEGMSIVSYHLTRDETNRVTIDYRVVSGPDVPGILRLESS